jgi:hypothetical protein
MDNSNPWAVTTLVDVIGSSYYWGIDSLSQPALGGFVFWNKSLGEAVYAGDSTLLDASVQGVHLERRALTATIPFGKNADTREKAEKWIEGAELLRVEFEPKGYYWTPLDVPNLKISVITP